MERNAGRKGDDMNYPPNPEKLIAPWQPRAVPNYLTAVARLDIALIPFIRPGTPISHDPIAARLHLRSSRRVVLVAMVGGEAE
jgi:hypothetical protein